MYSILLSLADADYKQTLRLSLCHLKVLISNGRNIYYYFCFKLIDCEGFVQLIASAYVIGTVKL